jgi:hypothetical protein
LDGSIKVTQDGDLTASFNAKGTMSYEHSIKRFDITNKIKSETEAKYNQTGQLVYEHKSEDGVPIRDETSRFDDQGKLLEFHKTVKSVVDNAVMSQTDITRDDNGTYTTVTVERDPSNPQAKTTITRHDHPGKEPGTGTYDSTIDAPSATVIETKDAKGVVTTTSASKPGMRFFTSTLVKDPTAGTTETTENDALSKETKRDLSDNLLYSKITNKHTGKVTTMGPNGDVTTGWTI